MNYITFDQKLVEEAIKWEIGGWPIGNLLLSLAALLLCVILVGIVGIERERKGRSAGLRTHLLVGIGSTIVMIISIYGFPAGQSRDIARLAAQVITGVGFLGAGAIMHRSSGIKGLTTAGTIWVSMAIGIACGSFNFILATAGTLLIFLVLTLFRKVEVKISKNNPTMVVVVPAGEAVLGKLHSVCHEFDASLHSMSSNISEVDGKNCVEIVFQVLFESGGERSEEFLARVEQEVKPISVHYLNRK